MRKLVILSCLIFLVFISVNSYSQENNSAVDSAINKDSWENENIVDILDSLVRIKYFTDTLFTTDTATLNTFGFASDSVPVYSDSVYEKRINDLNHTTTIELTYNKTVKNYINLYAVRKRELTSRMLGLAELYFPLFEEQLDRFNLPLELKYLAIVESALNPRAGSRVGAKGLWQFMYRTGKVYDLNVTTLIDERFDPMKSTIAACKHLIDLYDIYQNWSLVMAAYNSGAGNVNKAIRRSGKVNNYWAIWPYLPQETRGYVPAFIAVMYVMNYSAEHNLYPLQPGHLFTENDTVFVSQPLAFEQVSEMLSIPLEDIKFLNPQFKVGIIPARNGEKYSFRLPVEYIDDFIDKEKELYYYKSSKGVEREKLLAEIEKAKSRKVHYVKSGENLGYIAQRYHCYVSQIKRWNNLRSNTIYPGQKLIIYSPFDSRYKTTYSSFKRSGTKSYHIVQYGENLGLIAKKYSCTVTDLREWNNLRGNTIYPKQKLIIYKPESTTTVEKDGKFIYHTVRKGDTLWDIAKLYDNTTVSQIKRLNNIANSRRLRPGQKLKIAVIG